MEVIKNGKRNTGAFTFKCSKCGCKYKADVNDYEVTNNDTITCECPNCGKSNKKDLYKNKFRYDISKETENFIISLFTFLTTIISIIWCGVFGSIDYFIPCILNVVWAVMSFLAFIMSFERK